MSAESVIRELEQQVSRLEWARNTWREQAEAASDHIVELKARIAALEAAGHRVWDTIPTTYDEDTPEVKAHAAALLRLGALLAAARAPAPRGAGTEQDALSARLVLLARKVRDGMLPADAAITLEGEAIAAQSAEIAIQKLRRDLAGAWVEEIRRALLNASGAYEALKNMPRQWRQYFPGLEGCEATRLEALAALDRVYTRIAALEQALAEMCDTVSGYPIIGPSSAHRDKLVARARTLLAPEATPPEAKEDNG